MKRLSLILFLGSVCLNASSQYYCLPNYQATQNPNGAYYYEDLYSGGTLLTYTATPQWSSIGQIPFTFYFNNILVSEFKISSTGVLTFDVAAPTPPPLNNTTLPSTDIPNNSVCVWGMSASNTFSKIFTQQVASSGFGTYNQFVITLAGFGDAAGTCSTSWSIVFEEITNKIYLVNQASSIGCNPGLTLGIQIDTVEAYNAPGSPDIQPVTNPSSYTLVKPYYEFGPGMMPTLDVALQTATYYYQSLGIPASIRAVWRNIGSSGIQNLQFNYSIDSATIVSQTINVSSVATGQSQTFEFSTEWMPSDTGIHQLHIWTSHPNGGNDELDTNNHVIQPIQVRSFLPPRRAMFEEFKGTWCLWSGYWTERYDSLLGHNSNKASSVKYEQWSGNLDNPESSARHSYYNPYSIPSATVNGSYLQRVPSYYIGCPWNASQPLIDSLYEAPGLFYIQVDDLVVNGFQVSATGSVKSAVNFPYGTRCKLHVVLYEDTIVLNQPQGSSGETVFIHTARKMLPSANGTSLFAPSAGQEFLFDFNSIITSPSIDVTRLRVVAFVQDSITKEIYQCGESYNSQIICEPTSHSDTIWTCGGDSLLLNGQLYGSGVHPFTYTSSYGCDSAHFVSVWWTYFNLTASNVNNSYLKINYVSPNEAPYAYQWYECESDSPVIGATSSQFTPAASGRYYAIATGSTGCTRISNCVDFGCTSTHSTVLRLLCEGDSLQIGSNWYNQPGYFQESYQVSTGCDSTVSTSVIWMEDGFPLTSQNGTLSVAVPGNATFQWYSCETGLPVLNATNASFTPADQQMYYVIVTDGQCINTSVCSGIECQIQTHSQNVVLCVGDSVNIGSHWYTVPGTYIDILVNTNGCDSIVTTNVYYSDNPFTISAIGNLLTINQSVNITQAYSLQWYDCNTQTPIAGATNYQYKPDSPGMYSVRGLPVAAGCTRQSACLELTCVTQQIEQNVQINTGDSVLLGNIWIHQPGTYTYLSTTVSGGCDSSYTLHLSLVPSTTHSETLSICSGDSVNIAGIWYNQPGTYTHSYTAAGGIDSTVVSTLNIIPATYASLSFSICSGDSISIGTSIYYNEGTYVDVVQNALGCDSIVTTQLTLLPAMISNQTFNVCYGQSISVGQHTYSVPGSYTDVLTSAAGCDSTVYTTLQVTPVVEFSQTIPICGGDSVYAGNHWYSDSGSYIDTVTAAGGCDSIVHTLVDVLDPLVFEQTLSICSGDSVSVGDTSYHATGTYVDHLSSAEGCDSIVTTHLVVQFPDTTVLLNGSTLTASATSVSYQWFDCNTHYPVSGATQQTFAPTLSGSYYVQLTQGECNVTSACEQIIISSVGAFTAPGYALYPNPANKHTRIMHPRLPAGTALVLTDVTGRVLFTDMASSGTYTDIILDMLSPGSYYVRLEQIEKTLVVKKLILMKD